MQSQSAVAQREIADLEAKLASAKRRVIEEPKSLAEEVHAAEIELANAERVKRLVDLRLEQLAIQSQNLTEEAQGNVPLNFDSARAAQAKLVDVDHEIAKLSREQDVASTNLSGCQQSVAGLHRKRDETPAYAEFLRRQKEFQDEFTTVSAKALDAAATTSALLKSLEQLASREQTFQAASHSEFVGLGLVCADAGYRRSRLQSRHVELVDTIRRKFE